MDLILRNLSTAQADDLRAQLGGTPTPTPTPTPNPTPIPTTPPLAGYKVLDVPWGSPGRYLTASIGGFLPDDVLVVRFTTGSVIFPAGKYAKFSAAEYASSPSWRISKLSDKPGDLPPDSQTVDLVSTSLTIMVQVAASENLSVYPKLLLPNKTYYINIKNKAGAVAFTTGNADMFVDFAKPAGT